MIPSSLLSVSKATAAFKTHEHTADSDSNEHNLKSSDVYYLTASVSFWRWWVWHWNAYRFHKLEYNIFHIYIYIYYKFWPLNLLIAIRMWRDFQPANQKKIKNLEQITYIALNASLSLSVCFAHLLLGVNRKQRRRSFFDDS